MKVIATDASKRYNLKIKEYHRIVAEGEILELSEDRANFLMGNNPYGVKFVKHLDEKQPQVTKKPVVNNSNVIIEPTVKQDLPHTDESVTEYKPVVDEEPEVVVIKPKKVKKSKAKEEVNG